MQGRYYFTYRYTGSQENPPASGWIGGPWDPWNDFYDTVSGGGSMLNLQPGATALGGRMDPSWSINRGGGNSTSSGGSEDRMPTIDRTGAVRIDPNIIRGTANTGTNPIDSRTGGLAPSQSLGRNLAGLGAGVGLGALAGRAGDGGTAGGPGLNLGGKDMTDPQQQFLAQITAMLQPYMTQQYGSQPYSQLAGNYANYLGNNMPDMSNLYGNMGAVAQSGWNMGNQAGNYFNNQFSPTMQGNLSYLNQYGLPGNQQLQTEQQQLGGLGSSLLGTGGQYGVQQLLQQIMQQGLPNQQAIEGVVQPQLAAYNKMMGGQGQGYGAADQLSQIMNQGLPGQSNIQDIVGKASSMYAGGGLTPELIDAYTRQIYDPMQEKLLGQLNAMGGGVTNLGQSGQMQELQRRSMKDWQDQLLMAGFNAMPGQASTATQGFNSIAGANAPYTQMALQGGQNAMQNAMQAFGLVPSAVSPYANLAASTGLNAIGQGQNAFNVGSTQGLNALNTTQNLALQPYSTGMQYGTQGLNLQNQQGNTMTDALSQYLANQNQYSLGQQGLSNDTMKTLIAGIFGDQNMLTQLAGQKAGAWGDVAGSAISSLPAILKALGITK